MPTYMVAAIMLMHRKGIMEHILISKVEWLTAEILKRGARVSGISEHNGAAISVRNCVKLLNDHFNITKKTVFELSIAPCLNFKNILMLNYYRNGLIHVLYLEAICACAIFSFGYTAAF
jgi:glycerol-3-phosphate O-acyltransferase